MITKPSATFLAIILLSIPAVGLDKKALKDRYQGKFLVVLRDGLAVGICARRPPYLGPPGHSTTPPLAIRIAAGRAEYHVQTGARAITSECGKIIPDALHKGEVLRVNGVHPHKKDVRLLVQSASPRPVVRGQGALEHENLEIGTADLRFSTIGLNDDGVLKEIGQWLKVFDSQDQAIQFANTAGGPPVR